MDSVALITDSSACLPEARLPVRVVPVVIHLLGEDLRGDARKTAGLVYDALRRHEPVKSSAPTAVEYIEAIEETDAESIVVITPATEFTTMYRNASVAADLSGREVIVVDSRTAAAAQGLVVEEAAGALAAGGSATEAVRAAEDAAGRAELVAAMDGLDYLRDSGRVPPAAVGLARHLGIRPVFRLHGGVVERLGVPRSRQSALDRVAREAERRGVHEAGSPVVFHAADPDRASFLRRRLGVSRVTEFSPSMGIHTGPGVVGVAWLGPQGRPSTV